MKPKRVEKSKKAICRPTPNNWHKMNRKQRREMTRKIQSEDLSLEVVHPDAAGIDIGNESHYVAVPPTRDSQPVRRFGCTTSELKEMAVWLKQCAIRTIALQSIANWTKAQRLMDRQLKTKWPKLLNGIARQLNPIHAQIFRKHPLSYYWSVYQHEWALDVVFHHATDLRRFYPRWVNHAMTTFSSPDVLRFLGKRITLSGQLRQDFSGEVVSDFKRRAEGVRLKHSVNGNSVKLYDKAYTPKGSVLRAETTVHNGDDFRVYRRKEGDRKGPLAWRRLRRGISDLHRRAQLSHKAAARYLDAFATVDDSTTLDQLLQRLEQPRQWRGRRVRALRPLADDRALLSAINHGEFAINGFRNRDLRAIFFSQTTDDKKELRRRSAWISRKLRLLRAHALITKITGTHRYQITSSGRKTIVAVLSALRSTVAQLTPVTAQLTAVAA